ncbi:GMC oxidoreductase [Sedimenticola sp.]|uniref:GMC oxidoreductase n=1 Tax=Sedimenticola sp. TaxID=1940285 RepID=UPI003D10E469
MDRRHFLKLLGALSVPLCHPGLLRASDFSSDVLIIGAGACAFVLARELGASGAQVTILESGIKHYSPWHQALNQLEMNSVIRETDYHQSTRRQLGGTTWIWGGLCAPIQESDLQTRTRFGYGADWPIRLNDIQQHYGYAREILSAAPAEGQLPEEKSRFQGVRLEPAVVSRQPGVARALMMAARYPEVTGHPNIRLIVDASVRKIQMEGDRATLCEVQTQAGRRHRFSAPLVILAAGGVQNVRLLQLSADRHYPTGIGNQSDHLGRHFMEHPDVAVVVDVGEEFSADWGSVRNLFSFDFYNHSERHAYGAILLRMLKWDRDGGGEQVLLDLMCEQEARPENRLVLSDKKDALGDPLPRLEHHLSLRDEATLRQAHRRLKQLIGSRLHSSVQPVIRYNSHHPSGGTRMAEHPGDGVTDLYGRVHGTRNLYVAGSSLFPSNGAFHPTMTAVALSKRLADHLQKT